MTLVTVAFCTYNRADRVHALIEALRRQDSPLPFEILAVNNNSTDDTANVLRGLAQEDGVPLRLVTEEEQGIVPAWNRAIEETLGRAYLEQERSLPQLGGRISCLSGAE